MGVSKIVYDGNTLVDMTGVTVTPETLAQGITAFNAAGELITGTMESGVTVQRATGTFRTNSSGEATVNCGFKPDLVVVRAFSNSNYGSTYEGQLACSFTEKASNKSGIYNIAMNSSNYWINGFFEQTSNGFYIYMTKVSTSLSASVNSNASYSYIAIKYT